MSEPHNPAATAPVTTGVRTPDADDGRTTSGPDLTVRGGAGSIDARFEDVRTLGRLYGSVGPTLVGYAWDDKLEASDPDLLLSAVLSPATFAAAEAAIVDATYGPHGLAVRATVVEAQSVCFVAVVEFYEAAEATAKAAMDALAYAGGYALGAALPVLVVGGLGLALSNPLLTGAVGLTAYTFQDELSAEATALLEDHPELVQGLVDGGGGLLDGLLGWSGAVLPGGPLVAPLVLAVLGLDGVHPDTGSAADALGDLLFDDRPGEIDQAYAGEHFRFEPPRDVEDLVEDLATTNASGEEYDGVISLQRLVDGEGRVSWIVHLPGTDDFWAPDGIRNMGSNFTLIAGDDTAYAQAIRQAMEDAGVGHDEPVLLTGHSQGGMQAAALAADPDFDYHVTDVVTAGAPVATSGIPDHVNVLSLENTGDVVPLLDGEDNPAHANHTTVKADVHTGDIGANHDINGDESKGQVGIYEQIAGAVDDSDDPSVDAIVRDLHDHGFLGADGEVIESTTFTYQTQLAS